MNEIAFIDAFEPVISEQTRVASAFFSSGSIDEDRTEEIDVEDIDAFEPVISERTGVMPAFAGSALIDEDRADFRRWWFSAMLVVALHAAVGMAVLTWRITSKVLDPDAAPSPGPFYIDLAPLPAVRGPQQSLLHLESGLDRAAVPSDSANDAPEIGTAVNHDNSAEAAGLQRSEAGPRANEPVASSRIADAPISNSPVANSPIVDAPAPSAPLAAVPANNAGADEGSGGSGALHALAIGHTEGSPVDTSHAGRVDPGPIDTSITVLPSLRQRDANKFDHNRMILLRPLSHPGQAGPLRNKAGVPANATGEEGRNSLNHGPGAYVHDRVNAAVEREILRRLERNRNGSTAPGVNSLGMKSPTTSAPPSNAQGNSKNAIAATTANSIGDLKSGIINGTARNALGMPVQVHPSAHGIDPGEHREGMTGVTAAAPANSGGLMAAVPPTGVINGRNMVRPGMGLSVLGGPARNVPGSLNGSDFRSRHQ